MDKLQFVYTSDVVNVVRCRDCVYFAPHVHDRGDDSRCVWHNRETRADDYCSSAERRVEEDANA